MLMPVLGIIQSVPGMGRPLQLFAFHLICIWRWSGVEFSNEDKNNPRE
jgi:hypothetical protein